MKASKFEDLLRRKDLEEATLARAKNEFDALMQVGLCEAFLCFAEVVDALKERDIYLRLNGAINISALAYCAGLVDVLVSSGDYFFSRLVNPYQGGTTANALIISIDVPPDKVGEAITIARAICDSSDMQNTLFEVSEFDVEPTLDVYSRSASEGKSVLELIFAPSQELARFLQMSSQVDSLDPTITDDDLYKYIQSKSITVFDNNEKYLRVLRKLKPTDIDGVALALTLSDDGCEADRLSSNEIALPKTVEGILSKTYRKLVYQEQVMAILCKYSGCSPYHADYMRRSICKRANLKKLKREFFDGGEDVGGGRFCGLKANDLSQEDKITFEIFELGDVGFKNKSYWDEICQRLPRLRLKAHALARARFFLDCAILQLCRERTMQRGEYVVCDFTIIDDSLGGVYYKDKDISDLEPFILELSAVKISAGKIVDSYSTYVSMGDFDPYFLDFGHDIQFRGITPMTLLGAPSIENALRRLRDFVKGATLIARDWYGGKPLICILNECGADFGIRFDNRVISIEDILQYAEALRECFKIGNSDVLKIAENLSGRAREWKDIFEEYQVPFGREDCKGYAFAFAELVITLDIVIDVFT